MIDFYKQRGLEVPKPGIKYYLFVVDVNCFLADMWWIFVYMKGLRIWRLKTPLVLAMCQFLSVSLLCVERTTNATVTLVFLCDLSGGVPRGPCAEEPEAEEGVAAPVCLHHPSWTGCVSAAGVCGVSLSLALVSSIWGMGDIQ